MKSFFFTFGYGHVSRSGVPMRKFYVRVLAEDYNIARELFVKHFTRVYMPSPEKFAFQYSEEKFNAAFFTGGEYMLITQKQPLRNGKIRRYH